MIPSLQCSSKMKGKENSFNWKIEDIQEKLEDSFRGCGCYKNREGLE